MKYIDAGYSICWSRCFLIEWNMYPPFPATSQSSIFSRSDQEGLTSTTTFKKGSVNLAFEA